MQKTLISMLLLGVVCLFWDHPNPADVGVYKIYQARNNATAWTLLAVTTDKEFNLSEYRIKSGWLCVSAVYPSGIESDGSEPVYYDKRIGKQRK